MMTLIFDCGFVDDDDFEALKDAVVASVEDTIKAAKKDGTIGKKVELNWRIEDVTP